MAKVRVSVFRLKGLDFVDLVPCKHMSVERSRAKLTRLLRKPIYLTIGRIMFFSEKVPILFRVKVAAGPIPPVHAYALLHNKKFFNVMIHEY